MSRNEIAGVGTSLGLIFLSSLAAASDYCTKEQYEIDKAQIQAAFSAGTLVNGPKTALQREYVLVDERTWFAMNYLQQIAFMQSYECAVAGVTKHLLYTDVRSLATGKLLATWILGTLKPTEEPHDVTNPPLKPTQEPHDVTNPGTSEVVGNENRIGLTGEARAAFIQSAIDGCNKSGNSATYCSCFVNAMADSISIKELKGTSAPGTQEAGMIALRPKIDAAAKRCLTN